MKKLSFFSRRFSKKNADYSSDFFLKDQRTDRFYKSYKLALNRH